MKSNLDNQNTTLGLLQVLYYLALNPELQEQLHQEVDQIADTLADPDTLTYEDFASLEFMEGVIRETMRMAPVTPFIDRLCVKGEELEQKVPRYMFFLDLSTFRLSIARWRLHT